MKEMIFTVNMEQKNELEGLAYHIADLNYMQEKYGYDEPELEHVHKNIKMTFDKLDKLGVPFWVQNAVICFSENWRNYKKYGLKSMTEKRNIYGF